MNALTVPVETTGDRPVNGIALAIVVALFILVAVLGFFAARWRADRETGLHSLDEWGLGGRGFGTWVTWFLLGLHTTHVLTDFLDSSVLAGVMFFGRLDENRFVDVSENAMYWNFVVVSWLPIYAVIYLAPRIV